MNGLHLRLRFVDFGVDSKNKISVACIFYSTRAMTDLTVTVKNNRPQVTSQFNMLYTVNNAEDIIVELVTYSYCTSNAPGSQNTHIFTLKAYSFHRVHYIHYYYNVLLFQSCASRNTIIQEKSVIPYGNTLFFKGSG